MTPLPRLYAVADRTFGDPVVLARSLFEGGARLVQIRDKSANAHLLLDEVEQVLRFAPPDARVIVNDRCDVALLAGASGVHLGQDDLGPAEARAILREPKILGRSTHNLPQSLEADAAPVDYIAVGPIFQTSTKENP